MLAWRHQSTNLAPAMEQGQLLLHIMAIEVNLGQLFLLDPPRNIVANLVEILAVPILSV